MSKLDELLRDYRTGCCEHVPEEGRVFLSCPCLFRDQARAELAALRERTTKLEVVVVRAVELAKVAGRHTEKKSIDVQISDETWDFEYLCSADDLDVTAMAEELALFNEALAGVKA